MKYTILALSAAFLLAACNGEPKVGDSEATTETTTTTTENTEVAVADPNAKIDPVCDMVKDDTWTEYSVNGTDTTWFCSSTCKEAYDANPAKYAKK